MCVIDLFFSPSLLFQRRPVCTSDVLLFYRLPPRSWDRSPDGSALHRRLDAAADQVLLRLCGGKPVGGSVAASLFTD